MVRLFAACFFAAVSFQVMGQEVRLSPGKVFDTVQCKGNSKQSYSLYLPKAYNINSKWPVIFFYDPAARGNVPVKMYSSLAEKYQCILVGSNNSRNGPLNVPQESEQAILKDVESRLSIAPNRLFISGFSGGARASVFLSTQRRIYAGIIACGAAFPANAKLSATHNIPFVEIVGNTDMNFMEAIEAEDYLSKIKYPHSLIFFQGTHAWPPVEVYDQAIFWQLFKVQPPTKSLVMSYDSSLRAKAKQEIDSGNPLMANWNLDQAVLPSVKIDSLKKSISTDPLLKKQQKNFPIVLETERDFQREFYKLYERINYVTHDSSFKESEWKSLITKVKKFSKSEDALEVQMSERVLQQIKIGCVAGYQGEFELKRYLQASLKARIAILVQPDYQSYLLLARAYVKMDRKKDALTALSKSAELGLSDRTILDWNEFSPLVKEKKFMAVKEKVELNARKNSVTGH
jgi:dienelactone hydrolase